MAQKFGVVLIDLIDVYYLVASVLGKKKTKQIRIWIRYSEVDTFFDTEHQYCKYRRTNKYIPIIIRCSFMTTNINH